MELQVLIPFGILVIILLALDLGVFHKESHKITTKEAVIWSTVWISIGLLFGVYVIYQYNTERAFEYYSAFLIEKALSVDNLFVFALVFRYFKVPAQNQHTVLFWGIVGAIVLRAIFIFSGVWLIQSTYLPNMNVFGKEVAINPILLLFGVFLLVAGIKSAFQNEENATDFSKSRIVRFLKSKFTFTDEFHGSKFSIIKNGVRIATPMLLVVLVIEVSDLIFAVDSIPAIFAVSNEPFILYTSNIFAILGLRSLYFLLANSIEKFHLLQYGLGAVLSFIGAKMLIAPWVHMSSLVSLTIVFSLLVISVFASLVFPKKSA